MLSAMIGRPWVLAFVKAWDPVLERPEELRAIRAQLRGLGAVLVVLSDIGAWSFRPDDHIERLATGAETDREIAAYAEHYGVARTEDAVFVIDERDHIRFSHFAEGPLPTTLGDALRAAGTALAAQSTKRIGITFTRREWALASLCTGFAFALLGCKERQDGKSAEADPIPVPHEPPPELHDVVLKINGTDHKLRLEARVSLLDALRERLELTGTKKGCDHGQCGACTVHLDGRPVNSCLTLAIMAQSQNITTIEGLARGNTLHPVQAAFVEHDGFQCGYCTPGQIMSAVALLAEGRAKTDAEVREQMSGNICRCGAYPNIVAAVQAARKGA
jgi:xanthine dehydrogenase YagT iron-sulfur-binding subunit